MDKFQRNYNDSFKELPRSKYHTENNSSSRLGWLFKEQNNEQYITQGTVIFTPKSYDDVGRLIDHLKRGEQLIVDFSTTNQGVVARILDFMSGAIYALGGSVKKITQDIFLFAPGFVTVSSAGSIGR